MPMPEAAALLGQALVASRPPPLLPMEARDLVFEAGGKRLIDGIDLVLSAGAITVIMGPNGAGKSLLLRLLHGMIEPTAGTVRWGGEPPDDAVRRRQAMVFQRPVLLRRSVAANLEFVLSQRGPAGKERCRELLRQVELEALASRPARLLSGGEQQRLALVRALATEPEVLFLDEPTIGLDPAARRTVWDRLRQLRSDKGMTILISTHDMEEAETLCDELAILHQGRLATAGRPDALKAEVGPDATLADVFVHFSGAAIDSSGHASEVRASRAAVLRRG